MDRAFKGIWIPKEIWLSKDLTLQEKVFLVEINSLDNEEGCFASNGYFADFFQLSKGRVSQIISSLEKKELISLNYLYKLNSKEIEKRIIKINEEKLNKILGIKEPVGGIKETKGGIKETKHPPLENAKGNNTTINNTINKTKSKDLDKNENQPKSSLLVTKNKRQQKVDDIVTMKGMINVFTENESIRKKLLEYFNFRINRGLQPNQWQIILDDLRIYAKDNAGIALEKINNALAGGYMQIIAPWEKGKSYSNYNKQTFDNTKGREVKAVVNLTDKERQEYKNNLAKDEDGELLEF